MRLLVLFFNVSKVELLNSSVNVLIDMAGTNKTNKIGVKVKKNLMINKNFLVN